MTSDSVPRCRRCNAETSTTGRCWLCDADVIEATLVDEPYDNPYAAPALPPVSIDQSSGALVQSIALVGGLLLVMAVLFGIAPGLAVGVAIVTAPALIRTVIVITRKQRRGSVMSVGEQSVLFFASVAGVIAAMTAAAGAFFIACSAICLGVMTTNIDLSGPRLETTLELMGLGSVLFGIAVLFLMWKRQK